MVCSGMLRRVARRENLKSYQERGLFSIIADLQTHIALSVFTRLVQNSCKGNCRQALEPSHPVSARSCFILVLGAGGSKLDSSFNLAGWMRPYSSCRFWAVACDLLWQRRHQSEEMRIYTGVSRRQGPRDFVLLNYWWILCFGNTVYWPINRWDLRFEVFTAVNMKNSVFCEVTPCGSCKPTFQMNVSPPSTLMMDAIRSSRNVAPFKSHTALHPRRRHFSQRFNCNEFKSYESCGSGTGSTQPREYKWGSTWKKSSGSGL
jgi:hypothetical protein